MLMNIQYDSGPVMWMCLPEIVELGVTGVGTMLNWTTAALVSFAYPLIMILQAVLPPYSVSLVDSF